MIDTSVSENPKLSLLRLVIRVVVEKFFGRCDEKNRMDMRKLGKEIHERIIDGYFLLREYCQKMMRG